jgi:hypothetical protein
MQTGGESNPGLPLGLGRDIVRLALAMSSSNAVSISPLWWILGPVDETDNALFDLIDP